jgi:hypothetical protein
MKKIDSKKKLTLKREAVRTLTADELGNVDGGTYSTGVPPLKSHAFTCIPPIRPQ